MVNFYFRNIDPFFGNFAFFGFEKFPKFKNLTQNLVTPKIKNWAIKQYPESTVTTKNLVTGKEELEIVGWRKNIVFIGATFISRSVASLCSFPFEYRATILNGQNIRTKVIDKTKNSKQTTGLGSLILRDYMFSLTFWPIMENTKSFMRLYLGIENEM